MPAIKPFSCLMVRKSAEGDVSCQVESIAVDELPPGEVLIRVELSSLNYKDALACQAHPGVVRKVPHVPGIDCAGSVVESTSPDYQPGDAVLVTGYGQGSAQWGGYCQYVRAPADWVVPLPEGLTPQEAMTLGTAGFTAAQCVMAIQRQCIGPEAGEVAVTGATGGVGILAIALLSKLGYQVTAITGKPNQAKLLQQLGAAQILLREDASDTTSKPLLAVRWSAAVDTVGGNTLATLLRSTAHRGCIAACGLASSHTLPTTVYPFILRGITLAGIDSAQCPRPSRLEIWNHLATDWHLEGLEQITQEITLAEVPARAEAMLAGQTFGRTLVRNS